MLLVASVSSKTARCYISTSNSSHPCGPDNVQSTSRPVSHRTRVKVQIHVTFSGQCHFCMIPVGIGTFHHWSTCVDGGSCVMLPAPCAAHDPAQLDTYILSCCPTALSQECYIWQYNSILGHLVQHLKSHLPCSWEHAVH